MTQAVAAPYRRTRIKICGLRMEADVEAAVSAGADMVGFVFAKDSPRWIDPATAGDLAAMLPPMVQAVGVFRDDPRDRIADIAESVGLGMIQLHGSLPEPLVEDLADDFAVIRAVAADADAIRRWAAVDGVECLLIDSPEPGSGEPLDWPRLATALEGLGACVMLAGGLTPERVGEAIRIVRPFAVDVSSGVERERGVKDPERIRAFCRAVAQADLQSAVP